MAATDESTRNAFVEISIMIGDYHDDIDCNGGANAERFFTEDCALIAGVSLSVVGGGKQFEGHEGLRTFYASMGKVGFSTARHAYSNVRVKLTDPTVANVEYLGINYVGAGPLPIEFDGPSLVTQMRAICVHDPENGWRFQRLAGESLFIGRRGSHPA